MSTTRYILLLFIVLAATSVPAAWEDTGVQPPRQPVTPQPTRPVTTTPQRYGAPRQPVAQPVPAPPQPRYAPQAAAQPQPLPPPVQQRYGLTPPDLYSPFLDAQVEPLGWFSIFYAAPATVGDSSKDLTVVEVAGRYNLVQWRNLLGGDIDIDLRLRSIIFPSDANYENMPTALLELPLDFEWRWRFLNGLSLAVGARPGVFADIEHPGDGLALPFRGALYYAATPELSWLLGVEVRPGWDLAALPLAGLAWEPSDHFRLTLACPQSTALVQLGPIGFYGNFAWRNTTFGLAAKDGEPDKLTVADIISGAGLAINFTDSFRLQVEGGYAFNRSLILENSDDDDKLKVGNAPYLRVTFGGSF